MVKRIVLIRNSYAYDVGGAEIFPINLAKILKQGGYDPVMLSANNKTLSMAQAAKIKTKRSPWWSMQNFSGLRILLFPFYLIWTVFVTLWYVYFIANNQIDIVHPQSRDDFVSATLAAKLIKKRVVWSDHADLKHIYANHKVWYKNPVGKLVYFVGRFVDHVTVESLSEKKLIEESLGKKLPLNYKVVHLGVVDTYEPAKRKNGKVVFVATSRLVKAKGIGELIEAFKLLASPNAVLKLCGDGPDAAYFKSLAGDAINIEFLGHIDDIISVLQNSNVLVHPTYHEGFGLSLVEAEMCELPIIASNVGSIPEIVQDGVSGILVPPKNSKALAKAMDRILSNPKLMKDMGKAGRQIFLDNFQFDKIVNDSFLPLYEK